jgi:very-short-patch-repair endonuclease
VLRGRRLADLKFRRQHPIAGLIADFYCAELRLVLEIDGDVHGDPRQQDYDAERTARLESYGIRVLRLRNSEVTEARLRSLILPCIPPSPAMRERGRG